MLSVATIATPGLGDRSYAASDGTAAVVVDPQRDIDRVLAVLDDLAVPLRYVLETHIHNDYVSGGLELARTMDAEYVVAAAERVGFERLPVADGTQLQAGGMTLRALATPGHTPHHLAYVLVLDGSPEVVFTGGSMLYGTVGRTDLMGRERTDELTRAQYRSVRRLLEELPGEVGIRPTHGFGSFCSSLAAPPAGSSTVAEERRHSPAATAPDEDGFVQLMLAGLIDYPSYYARMAPINRAGPPPVDLTPAPQLDPDELARRAGAGDWVVDVRARRMFATAHVPGSLNIAAGDNLATYLGWVVPWGAPVTLAGDDGKALAEAQRAIARIGFDRPAGTAEVTGGSGSYPVALFTDLARVSEQRDVAVLDVRRADEWEEGHLAGALHLPLPDLLPRMAELPDQELWVHCRSGYRAAIGASLLARAGRRVVLLDEDFDAAAAAGLAVV
jgi:hydroxyacylglutathione hydrolase